MEDNSYIQVISNDLELNMNKINSIIKYPMDNIT